MTITLLIIAYVLNVFLNRWLSQIIYRYDYDEYVSICIWFVPIISTIFLFIVLISISTNRNSNWFTGKYWK